MTPVWPWPSPPTATGESYLLRIAVALEKQTRLERIVCAIISTDSDISRHPTLLLAAAKAIEIELNQNEP